ncbi:MAG TPA: sigma-70 family RNA polymerase sigma factor [Opitutaceae bacterium]|jgi:RNA polymerase sigma-70 factor (ECF subfamily)|nr:sigma-70 family RNA polymerase sigma factor [Opitutaceae bacterium]
MIYSTESSFAATTARTPSDRTARLNASKVEALYDASLVTRFNSGDEPAFVEMITRHRDRVFAVAFNMLKNHADAEEIVQDTFMRAHRGLAKFRGDSSLSTWLHRISMNLSRNRYWYFFRRRQHSTVSLNLEFGGENTATVADLIASDSPSPATEASSSDFLSLVAGCMAKLGADARRILVLRNTMDRSYGQIARELGVNIGTVKSRIARARRNLRVLLSECSPEFNLTDDPLTWFDCNRSTSAADLIAA